VTISRSELLSRINRDVTKLFEDEGAISAMLWRDY